MRLSRRVSIKDIAKAAGVSYSTVSRALNKSPLIRPEVRERIQDMAQSMGYSPNALAQSLQSLRSKSIGLIITNVSDPFFADVVQGVEEVARQASISVLLATSDNNAEEEIKIIEMLSRRRVDGVIVAASRIGADYAAQLEQVHIPVIMINNQAEGEYQNLYAIAIDDFAGGCLAVEHLIALGHRRIGYIGVKNRPSSNERRMEGYIHTLARHAVQIHPGWIQMNEGMIPEGLSGDLRAGHDLALNLIKLDLTAVFCYCDSIAAGMLTACREVGIQVPEQMSIVGFDDSDLCPLLCPPLTTIRQPKRDMGKMAMEMLITSMAGGMVNNLKLEPGLVVRQSTAAPDQHRTTSKKRSVV